MLCDAVDVLRPSYRTVPSCTVQDGHMFVLHRTVLSRTAVRYNLFELSVITTGEASKNAAYAYDRRMVYSRWQLLAVEVQQILPNRILQVRGEIKGTHLPIGINSTCF